MAILSLILLSLSDKAKRRMIPETLSCKENKIKINIYCSCSYFLLTTYFLAIRMLSISGIKLKTIKLNDEISKVMRTQCIKWIKYYRHPSL